MKEPVYSSFLKKPKNLLVLRIIIVLLALTVIIFARYSTYRWQQHSIITGTDNKIPPILLHYLEAEMQAQIEAQKPKQAKTIPIINDKLILSKSRIAFTMPKDWVQLDRHLDNPCDDKEPAVLVPKCVDMVDIIPASLNLPLKPHESLEYRVDVRSYKNDSGLSAKAWYTTSFPGSFNQSDIVESVELIGGHDAYTITWDTKAGGGMLYIVNLGKYFAYVNIPLRQHYAWKEEKERDSDYTPYLKDAQKFVFSITSEQ